MITCFYACIGNLLYKTLGVGSAAPKQKSTHYLYCQPVYETLGVGAAPKTKEHPLRILSTCIRNPGCRCSPQNKEHPLPILSTCIRNPGCRCSTQNKRAPITYIVNLSYKTLGGGAAPKTKEHPLPILLTLIQNPGCRRCSPQNKRAPITYIVNPYTKSWVSAVHPPKQKSTHYLYWQPVYKTLGVGAAPKTKEHPLHVCSLSLLLSIVSS